VLRTVVVRLEPEEEEEGVSVGASNGRKEEGVEQVEGSSYCTSIGRRCRS
jgi:hypothetical protein